MGGGYSNRTRATQFNPTGKVRKQLNIQKKRIFIPELKKFAIFSLSTRGWKTVTKKPDFIFYDGWMVGAKRVEDESIFESGLPALDTPEHIQFAKDINKKLEEYLPLWELFDFLNVLYVPNYEMSLKWRDQAEEKLRAEGKGMTSDQIREFVYYFWRSVHPGIQIKNLSYDEVDTDQVVIINDDHTIKEILSPKEVKIRYP